MISYRQAIVISLSLFGIIGLISIFHVNDISMLMYRYSGDEIKFFHNSKQEEFFSASDDVNPPSQVFNFKVRSHNVRVDTHNRFPHEKHWKDRRDWVVKSFKDSIEKSPEVPVLFGLQELKHHQLNDILKGLNSDNSNEYPWTHYGVGRDDGYQRGEYAPIIYNSEDWLLVNGTSRWLSSSPNKPIKSWGAATKRVITFTTFKNKKMGNYVNFINTHLDHKSDRAKRKSAKLIIDWIAQIPNDYPTFLSGDLNSERDGIAYKLLATKLSDSNSEAQTHQYCEGAEYTYTGFERDQQSTVIDYIWSTLGNCHSSKIKVTSYTSLANEDSGVRFSDHRPIEADFLIEALAPEAEKDHHE